MVEGGGWWRIKSESLEEKNKSGGGKKICMPKPYGVFLAPSTVHPPPRSAPKTDPFTPKMDCLRANNI